MNCKQSQTLLGAYADGEANVLQGYSIEKHLLDCAACASRRESVLTLRARIRAEVPYFVASPALHARVCAAVGSVCASAWSRPRPTSNRWRWLTGGMLAGCTASIFAWMVGTTVLAWRANEEFALAAVAAHARATQEGLLIEVASSDRHTVKPWLSARLDYSPPVQELTNEGFRLVGGRLDYLEQRNVATLVYRYGEHTIDVFVRPDGSRVPTPAPRSLRGFNVADANGQDMHWLAVSDVDATVLSAFVQQLARQDISR